MKNKTLKIFTAITVTIILAMTAFAIQNATRITFAKGKSSATMSGTVGDSAMNGYIIRVQNSDSASCKFSLKVGIK